MAAAGLFLAPRAMAFGPFHHGGCGAHAKTPEAMSEHLGRRMEFVLDRIDATDAQRARVRAILEQASPELFALATEGRALREELRLALSAKTIDDARIAQAQHDLDALANRATDIGLGTLTSVAKVLTPEQRAEVAEHLARFRH